MNFEIQIIAILISISCSLLGTFLVLRKMAMMTDAISHTVLLGIVLAFLLSLDSSFLIIGASFMGILTVWITEFVAKKNLVYNDCAIGLVFPFLFSIAIILISKFANHVHLDIDSVMLGELAFASFDRLIIFGIDIGAFALYSSAILLLFNALFLFLFYKEFKICTFDPLHAISIGISPVFFHYLFMTLVSITTVSCFNFVGSVLVIAFMIVPANTAYLLTTDLQKMLILSPVFSTISAILGYIFACIFDVSIAGSICFISGIIFFIVFLFTRKNI